MILKTAISRPCKLLPVLLIITACSGRQPLPQPLVACSRAVLDPSPVWTASSAWTEDESHLLLVDPRTESLMAYDRSGALRRQVELESLAELDFSVPIRLQSRVDGYTIGDRQRVVWLDRDFERSRLFEPFAENAEGTSGTLNDFVAIGPPSDRGALVAFADSIAADGTWERGFQRFALDASRQRMIHAMPFESGGELDLYYLYDRRPYLTALGNEVYALRYTDPPRIFRIAPRRLEPLATVRLKDGFEAWALYAHNRRLWLLASRLEATAENVAPSAIDAPADEIARLQSAERLHSAQRGWRLLEIDPISGRQLARFALPSAAQRLQIVPGRAAWALVEETSAPNLDGANTTLLLLPASTFRSRGDGLTVLSCD